jgi:phosphate transport system substrate-binding protein
MLKRYWSCILFVFLFLGVIGAIAQEMTPAATLANREEFTTLVSLVEAAGLTDILNGEEALTIFAPTNAAFAALPDSVVAYLGQDAALLTRVLTYHVVAGGMVSSDVTTMSVATLETTAMGSAPLGSMLDLVVDATGVHVDGVDVIEADIIAGESVIHAINGVLIPAITLEEMDALEFEGDINIAGSSTVFPLTERMADLFSEEGFADVITLDSIGTGAGFERFCVAAETDIANASRAIRDTELASCLTNNRIPLEFRVGTDALALAVSIENDFLTDLTLAELARVYSGDAKLWSDINAAYPAEPIVLYSPGTDSGTFDYFVEEVFDEDDSQIRASGAQFSENDNVLVQGVESSIYAIGYFGYAYYQENQVGLKILSINGIAPTETTAESGEYPLARPLFIYSDTNIIMEKSQVGAFINFYLSNVNAEILDVGYFPASKRALNLAKLSLIAAMNA